MKITLIQNRSAGEGETTPEELLRLLEAAGHDVDHANRDQVDLAEAVRRPTDLIAVAGGDGTVGDVITEMPPDAPPVAVLPLGTANNIATSLGICGDVPDLIAQWDAATPRAFRLWTARGPWGERLLVEGCGVGALTRMAAAMDAQEETGHLDREAKLARGRRRLCERLAADETIAMCADLDGERIAQPLLLLEVTNIGSVGPRLPLATADPFDDRLEVIVATESDRAALCDWVQSGAYADTRPLRSWQVRTVRLDGVARFRVDDWFYPAPDESEAREAFAVEIGPSVRSVRLLVPG